MSFEEVECKSCKEVGKNKVEDFAVRGHPGMSEEWLICQCGEELGEIHKGEFV
jgi:hypothetical protein